MERTASLPIAPTQPLIGIKATVLNRAKIGRFCLIGAHSLVTEDKEIPDRSLVVGVPGKVVRQLTDAEVAHLIEGIGFRDHGNSLS